MSRTNVLGKGTLSLIIGGLAIAITLSGCDSPVGSATETTTTLPPAPRDGVMRVLPDRFALDIPGALLPQADSEVQPLSVRTSSGDSGSAVDEIFAILEGEYVNALMYNAFWFLIADEILSRPDVDVDQVNKDFDFKFDDDLADRLDEYFESIPLYELIRENERYESSEWNSYREEDILGNTFIGTYSYIQSNSDIYDRSFRMRIAFGEPDFVLADIAVFWSNDLKRSAFFGNSETSFRDGDGYDNITFFALDEEEGKSLYLFVEFENDAGNELNFEEANFREHPSLSKGAFFRGKGSADGDVILGVADDDGYSLQVGNGQREYRDSSRKIIPSAAKYDFDVNTDFAGMDAVATLLDSGFEIRPRFRPVLTNSND